MQKLRLEELLRYALSGALFLVGLLLLEPTLPSGVWGGQNSLGEATKALGLVLLTGSLIYTFHRALVFPLFLYPTVLSIVSRIWTNEFSWTIWAPFRVSEIEQRLDESRFALRRQKDLLSDIWIEWATQVHFLYCSAEATFFALVIGRVFGGHQHRKTLLVVGVSLLIAGLVHHVSLIYRARVVWQPWIDKWAVGGLSKTPVDAIAPTE